MAGLYSSPGLLNEAKLTENYDVLAYYYCARTRNEGYGEFFVMVETRLKVNETDLQLSVGGLSLFRIYK